MLFQMLSDNDKNMIQKWIDVYSGVEEVGNPRCDRAPLSELLSYWALEKKQLFRLFGNQLIVSKTVDFKKPEYLLNEEMDLFVYNQEAGSYFRDKVNHMTYWTDNEALKEVHYDIMTLFSPSTLSKNVYEYESFKIPTPDGKFIQVQKGCKPVKILGKFATAWDIDGFEEFRLGHSQVLNQKALKGELCLSIHPMDYMTMSDNECDWDSCMSWRNDGCYKRGTVEMMNSRYVVVAYLKAKEDMTWWRSWRPLDTEDTEMYTWNNKKWRELFIVDPSCITGVKGYPYQNPDLEAMVINWLAELAEKNLGYSYMDKVYQYDHCENFTDDNGHKWNLSFHTYDMYNDFGTREHYARLSSVSDGEYVDITYSGCHTCMWCGSIHGDYEDEGRLVCGDCLSWFYCESCDERIYNEEPYYLDGNRLCQYCYEDAATECVITGENHYASNMTQLYLAIEQDRVSEIHDPSIFIYEPDISMREFDTYFKTREWHEYQEDHRWWRKRELYLNPDELTLAGLELFGYSSYEEVAEVAKERAEARKEEEERIAAEQKAAAERRAREREEHLKRAANELAKYTIEFTLPKEEEEKEELEFVSDKLSNVVYRFFSQPWN